MGLFDDGSIASTIARLVQSPRVQYIGKQLRGTAQNYGAVPLQPRSNSGMGNSKSRKSGAYPNIGSSISDIARIAAQSQGQPQAQQSDPLMDLYAQLLSQLQAPVNMPTGIDTDNLMEQVRKAIDPIYDQRERSAQQRSDRARGEVKSMYRTLSDDYERLAPEQVAQADAAKQEIEQMYGQLRSNIKGDYSRISDEQSELFKSLGIEAALPDVLEEQEAPIDEALVAASENQTQQQQRYMDIGQMDSTYYREGSPNATMQGNNISTDMLFQLNDYLDQLGAERTSGIQSAYTEQLGQAQSQLGQQQQMAQSEAARRQEMLWQMLQGSMNGKQQQELNPDTFMGQLPQNMQQSVAGAFTKLQRSPEAVYGKVEDKRNPVPGSFVETTPNWYLAQADEMLRRGEIDATTHQALQMYMSLYFQMGR